MVYTLLLPLDTHTKGEQMKKLITTSLVLLAAYSCGQESSSSKPTAFTKNLNEESTNRPNYSHLDLYSFSNSSRAPQKNDIRYLSYESKVIKGLNSHNHISIETGVKDISIRGLKVIIKKGGDSGLFEKIYKRSDVKNFSIDAEIIEIHDAIHLAGSKVSLTAKTIRFVGEGSINTTPLDPKSITALQFQDGVDGLNAGSIYLHADEVIDKGRVTRLIANGGIGQNAGPGQAGDRGTNAVLKYGYHKYVSHSCYDTGRGAPICMDNVENGRPAGNGQNGKIGGKPGEPGEAGFIYTNKDFNLKTSQVGAKAGAEDSTRLGGLPGSPATTCAAKFRKGRKIEFDCRTAVVGASAVPQKAKKNKSTNRQIKIKRTKVSWVSNLTTPLKLKYIEDLYKAGRLEASQKEIKTFNSIISKNVMTIDRAPVMQKLSQFSNQMDMRLDFYGNKKTWVPNLGFEVNYVLFKNEVKRNIEVLYLSNSIANDLNKEVHDAREILDFQSGLFENIQAEKNKIDKTIDGIVTTNEALGEVKVAEEEFRYELSQLEKEIRAKAKNNIKVPFMDKAVKIFAAASKVIPVGQPALGIVGSGVDFFHSATNGSMTTGEILSKVPSMYTQFSDVDWGQTQSEIHEKIEELSLSNLEGMQSWEERARHLKKISDFTSPVFKAVADQMSEWRELEGDGSKLDREIDKIKRSHSMYQKVIESLENLNLKKKIFKDRVVDFQSSISKSLVAITSNYSAVALSFEDIETMNTARKRDYINAIEDVKRLASNSLHYYGYLLEKSYEYRLLKDYESNFDLKVLTDEVLNLINIGSGTTVDHVTSLEMIYNAQLTEITNTLLDNFNTDGPALTLTKEISLTSKELNTLNAGKDLYVDTTNENFFGENKENIRLLDLEVVSMETSGESSEVEVNMSHSGRSVINQNSVNFAFDFKNIDKNTTLHWTSTFNPLSGNLYHSDFDISDESLLRNLLGMDSIKTHLFTSPGARTFIKINLKKSAHTRVESSTLRLEYSYKIK